MRIKCPYCGERDAAEFAYLGAADLKRPDPGAADAANAFYDYVYLRDNPAGPHAELWYHAGGCRSWLRRRARHAQPRDLKRRSSPTEQGSG